jgi:hypothetical protein
VLHFVDFEADGAAENDVDFDSMSVQVPLVRRRHTVRNLLPRDLHRFGVTESSPDALAVTCASVRECPPSDAGSNDDDAR